MPQLAPQKQNHNSLNTFLNDYFNLVVVFIVIVFLLASYYVLIRPKFEATLVSIRDNITQQEQFYQNQRQKLADLQAAAALYHKVGDIDINKVNSILPDEYAKEKIFGELEDILIQQGIMLNSIKLTKGGESTSGEPMAAQDTRILDIPNSDRVGVIEVEMNLSATDYASLKNLLPILESNLQLIDVQSLDFSPAEKTANIIFYTYYFK